MTRRHKERELALELAYALDLTGDDFEDARFRFVQVDEKRRKAWGPFAERLVSEMTEKLGEIDSLLRPALQHWRLERLSAIDRSTLRLAACELLRFPDIPLRVTIDEYLDIARDYGGDESPAFINGVLDAVSKKFPEKDFALPRKKTRAAG